MGYGLGKLHVPNTYLKGVESNGLDCPYGVYEFLFHTPSFLVLGRDFDWRNRQVLSTTTVQDWFTSITRVLVQRAEINDKGAFRPIEPQRIFSMA